MRRIYTISTGDESRTATSLDGAIATARKMLLAERLYRGARYVPEMGTGKNHALDLWIRPADARQERGVPADAVVSW